MVDTSSGSPQRAEHVREPGRAGSGEMQFQGHVEVPQYVLLRVLLAWRPSALGPLSCCEFQRSLVSVRALSCLGSCLCRGLRGGSATGAVPSGPAVQRLRLLRQQQGNGFGFGSRAIRTISIPATLYLYSFTLRHSRGLGSSTGPSR